MVISSDLLKLEENLQTALQNIKFEHVAEVLHPLDYAYKPYRKFVGKYVVGPKKILFVGLNPSPLSSLQTGIPFGDVDTVKKWFKITREINEDKVKGRNGQGVASTIQGMTVRSSPKSESGRQFWEVIKKIYGKPRDFFKHAYVYNYCPLAFFDENRKSITPRDIVNDKSKRKMEELCNETLTKIIILLEVETIIAIGKYSEKKAKNICKRNKLDIPVIYLIHPSSRGSSRCFLCNSYLNTNWIDYAKKVLLPILPNPQHTND